MKKYLFLIFTLLIGCNSMEKKEQQIIYEPIGYFETGFTPEQGAPRQGRLMPEKSAKIVVGKEYVEALANLAEFEYIFVLFHFDLVKSWEAYVIPPASEHRFGMFATRTPRRPNPIGMTIVKLEKIQDNVLFIKGADAFDGTPVLDIKPYLPSVDCVESHQNEETEEELGHHDEVFIKDTVFE